jgi:hypothetical protein
MQHSFVQNEIIADEKDKDIEQRIGAPAGYIAEGLNGHQLSKGRIKKINKGSDLLFWHIIRKFPREGNAKR